MIIEARQACFDPCHNEAERCLIMRTAIEETLHQRGLEIKESMMDEPESEALTVWTYAIENRALCVEAIVEKVNHRVGGVIMSNFEIKFCKEEYAIELVSYNDTINKVLPKVRAFSWCELHPFYAEQTEDYRVVMLHSENEANKNNNKHNNTSGRYTGRGSTKIEGSWQNPFRNNNNDIKSPPLSLQASFQRVE